MRINYFLLEPDKIVEDIFKSDDIRTFWIKDLVFSVFPNVYPSDQFRSSMFILDTIESISDDITFCDMGCGMGLIGQVALFYGARKVVQADINPVAVENARYNKKMNKFVDSKLDIYESDCFDNIPEQSFDVIAFNIPFHSEPYNIKNPLESAFFDPNFKSLRKFLAQSKRYAHQHTQILIVFSNKGNVQLLEENFNRSEYNWSLWKIANAEQKFDSRIYLLKKK